MNRRKTLQSMLLALLLALGAAALLAVLPRRAAAVVVQADAVGPFIADGETPQLRNFFGFREPEQAGETPFRWTSGAGSFVVRNGARLGTPLLLDTRLCGCRTSDAPAPRLWLRANGVQLAEAATTARWNEWRRYRLLIPPGNLPTNDLLLELLSDSMPNAESRAPLGVAFQRASLAPLGTQRAFTPAAALGLGLLVGGVGGAALLRGGSPARALLHGALALALAAAQGFVASLWLPAGALAGAFVLAVGIAGVRQEPRIKNQEPTQRQARDVITSACQLVLLALPVVLTQMLGTWMLDDAYISFRYARNALMGHGLVFNLGERVEGYTNFLWTALFVPLLGAGADPATASQIITLLLALLIVALTWRAARRVAGAGAAFAALALLVTSAPFLLYTARGSGMETALFTLLLLAGVREVRGQGSGVRGQGSEGSPQSPVPSPHVLFSGALLALAAMTRPEGVLVAGVVGLYLLGVRGYTLRKTQNAKRKTQNAVPPALAFALGFLVLFAPYYLWRYSYYGYPLPNTFYAKVGGSGAQVLRGLEYAADFAVAQWPLVVLAVGCTMYDVRCTIAAREIRTTHYAIRHIQLVIGIYTLYIIAVGGDHFPFYRFFVPLLPLLTVLAAAGLHALTATVARSIAKAQGAEQRADARLAAVRAACLVAVVLVGVSYHAPQLYASRTLNADGRVWGENSVVEKNREIGLWLRANTPPDTLIATGIAGALPYYSARPVLDALGLNDLHIAHLDVATIGTGTAGAEKTDVPYILSRRPAYIPYNSAAPFLADPLFATSYRRMTVRGPEGRAVRLYRRADLPAPPGSREASQ